MGLRRAVRGRCAVILSHDDANGDENDSVSPTRPASRRARSVCSRTSRLDEILEFRISNTPCVAPCAVGVQACSRTTRRPAMTAYSGLFFAELTSNGPNGSIDPCAGGSTRRTGMGMMRGRRCGGSRRSRMRLHCFVVVTYIIIIIKI